MDTNVNRMDKGEIILYQPDDNIRLEVRMEDETVWLNRQQMAILFNRDVKNHRETYTKRLTRGIKGMPNCRKICDSSKRRQ